MRVESLQVPSNDFLKSAYTNFIVAFICHACKFVSPSWSNSEKFDRSVCNDSEWYPIVIVVTIVPLHESLQIKCRAMKIYFMIT